MIAAWCPKTLLATFLQFREFLTQYPAGSTFEPRGNKIYGILWWILNKKMDVITTY